MGDKVEKKEKGIKIWKCIVSVSFIILSVMLVYLLIWTKNIFGDIPFSQVLFHMMVPLEGTDTSIIMSYVYGASKWVGIAAAVMVVLGVVYHLSQKSKKTEENCGENTKGGIKYLLKKIFSKIGKGLLAINKFLIRRMLPVTAMVLVLVLVVDFVGFGMDEWVADRLNSSTLYEEKQLCLSLSPSPSLRTCVCACACECVYIPGCLKNLSAQSPRALREISRLAVGFQSPHPLLGSSTDCFLDPGETQPCLPFRVSGIHGSGASPIPGLLVLRGP